MFSRTIPSPCGTGAQYTFSLRPCISAARPAVDLEWAQRLAGDIIQSAEPLAPGEDFGVAGGFDSLACQVEIVSCEETVVYFTFVLPRAACYLLFLARQEYCPGAGYSHMICLLLREEEEKEHFYSRVTGSEESRYFYYHYGSCNAHNNDFTVRDLLARDLSIMAIEKETLRVVENIPFNYYDDMYLNKVFSDRNTLLLGSLEFGEGFVLERRDEQGEFLFRLETNLPETPTSFALDRDSGLIIFFFSREKQMVFSFYDSCFEFLARVEIPRDFFGSSVKKVEFLPGQQKLLVKLKGQELIYFELAVEPVVND